MTSSQQVADKRGGFSPKGIFKKWAIELLEDWEKAQLFLSLVIMAIIALLPLFIKSPYYLGIIAMTVLYAFVGMAWNFVGGYAGQLLIGHITFFGVGAYTAIMLLQHVGLTPWLGIFVAAIPSVILALIFAFLTLRYGLKLDYFALFTLAVMVTMGIIFSQIELAGGAEGLWIEFKGFSFSQMTFKYKWAYIYIALGLLLIGLILNYKLLRSKIGTYWLAIRDDELAAAVLGVNISRYKTIALVITAALEGIGGGFYVMYTTVIEPPLVFNLAFNVELITAPLIGGLGTIIGPILGAIVNKPVIEIIRGALGNVRAGSSQIIYGLFLIIFILYLRRGFAGLVQDVYLKIRKKVLLNEKED